ncbi:YdcF family protein [Desulfobacterota bacterium AH_259_B03_O07]|nr:YdcF family protein [Desulfobacterota bacterium AH_259_B03_O07]
MKLRSYKVIVPAVLFILFIALYLYRIPILTAMGEYLYSPTSLKKADLVVALGGNRWRQREAVALMKKGLAGHILFVGSDVEQSDYNCLGVSRERAIPANMPTFTTGDEALVILKTMQERRFKSAIVVTSWYHLRRASLTFRKAFDGEGINLMFHPSNHAPFDAKTWWRSHIGRKAVAMEYIGLASAWIRY